MKTGMYGALQAVGDELSIARKLIAQIELLTNERIRDDLAPSQVRVIRRKIEEYRQCRQNKGRKS